MAPPANSAPGRALASCRAAMAAYRSSLGEDFEPCAVAYAEGRVLSLAGFPDLARETWLAALALPSARGWPYLMNALVGVSEGREREVAEALGQHAARLPELALWQGHLMRRAGDAAAALPLLADAERRNDGELRFTATNERMSALLELGRLDEALDVCVAAVAAQAAYAVPLRVSQAGLLTRACRADEALEVLDAVLDAHPTAGVAWLNRGAALLRLGRRTEARDALDRAVACDAGCAVAAAGLWGPA